MNTTIPFEHYGEMLTNVAYCSADPAQTMDIYFPASGGPWPAVVYVHGGGWMHGDKSEAAMFAMGMSSLGYLVVSINYRLSPAATFPAMIEDVKCAIRALRAQAADYNLDPNRIAAMGASAGGHLVSLLGTTEAGSGWDVGEHLDQSSRVQAVISLAGLMDMSQPFPNAEGNDIETMNRIGFNESNKMEASPITHVTADDPPFLLIHGERDELVPYEQSQLMYERLVQANVPAQLVIVSNASHSFDSPDGNITPTLGEINQIILKFLVKYLA
ncbi:MAG TPA: alpha/beta hydrolase [Anaerolineales bacterium]|nr:alpha/beta hydrolase [Anaerolineales bacterium]